MANRKKPLEERSVSGLNFVIKLPLTISLSSTESFQKHLKKVLFEYNEKFKDKVSISDLSRECLFELLEVNNEKELMNNYKNIKETVLPRLKEELRLSLGVYNSQFSLTIINKLEDKIKVMEKKVDEKG